ncbi:hypothetical protein EJ06DRAFT_538063 [Trichodelitschia bisporula]|uniref:Nephrocystin 3-like N-terminal domain-containing protein n=1 Tax=Trichodelitschia bisporula TaxID=703511 RepID=A0A6G1HX25_9PEZI|nr:hypothetical protein EJ06DRAFT_538063 [Trichodelitschia bisporula]
MSTQRTRKRDRFLAPFRSISRPSSPGPVQASAATPPSTSASSLTPQPAHTTNAASISPVPDASFASSGTSPDLKDRPASPAGQGAHVSQPLSSTRPNSHGTVATASTSTSSPVPPQERKIIEKLTKSTADTFQDVIRAAEKNRDLYQGQSQNAKLREVTDGVIRWLDKFKGVGDILSNADPLHFGFAWAGFRLVLEFHAHILRFLAESFQFLDKSKIARAIDAIWNPSGGSDFEAKCVEFRLEVQGDLYNCGHQIIGDLDEKLKELEDLPTAGLPWVKGAAFDSSLDEDRSECLQGTRTELLRQIQDWAKDPDGKFIFWLNGVAGTGKSTISRTAARIFERKGQLGASFFFKRGEGDRGKVTNFFTTIASQLAIKRPQVSPFIARTIDNDPTIVDKSPYEQFQKLIIQPLNNASLHFSPLIIVIDALDECEQDVRSLIGILEHGKNVSSVQLRVFVTSRPELPIRLGFIEMSKETHHDAVLHEIQQGTVSRDLTLYLHHELAEIRRKRNLLGRTQLPSDWPGDETIQRLVEMALPLFIFAATVCRFIDDPHSNPKKVLDDILKHPRQDTILERTYLPILERQIAGQTRKRIKDRLVAEFREIVGTIITLATPLSIMSIAELLGVPEDDIETRLDSLHSVLSIPEDKKKPVRLLHLSFHDFLVDVEKVAGEFWVDEHEMHGKVTTKCLELMSQPDRLKQDMCMAESGKNSDLQSFLLDAEKFLQKNWRIIEHAPLQTYISALTFAPERSVIRRQFHTQKPRWVRLQPKVQDWDAFLQTLKDHSDYLASASDDSTVRLWDAGSGKTLQTLEGHSDYVRAVAFSPDGKQLASASDDSTVRLWDAASGKALQTLEGHSDAVNAVAFWPDGKQLASASYDLTVRLWDAGSGKALQTLKGQSDINAVAFWLDGKQIVEEWITIGAEKHLWLPDDYRSPYVVAIHGDKIGLGYSSGRVLCMKFIC